MKVLLAVDGSPYTQRMLAYLAAHDELLGPTHDFTAVTVVAPVPRHAADYLDRSVLDTYYREEAEAVFKPVRAFAEQKRWRLETVAAHGNAAEVIASQAESGKYDLIVMGSHGHSPVMGLVLGSVVTRVLAQSKVPVLLVR